VLASDEMAPRGPASFPALALPDVAGQTVPLERAWQDGPALLILGHWDCQTTRETLPRVERIHRRRGPGASVVAVLQDDVGTARALAGQFALTLPILLEAEPYPLAQALSLEVVPALYLVERGGAVAAVSEAFRRADLEAFASRLGVAGPLFGSDETVPSFRPG
jgi:hypothetical protein